MLTDFEYRNGVEKTHIG